MKLRSKILVLSLCFSIHPAAAYDEIVVTAIRIPLDIDRIGSAISTIDADTIEDRQYQFAFDAIGALPGVTVNQTGAFGGAATIRLRGALSEQTLVLLDGVTVNDPASPGGGFDFSTLDVNDIERIEVLRGPQSTLYGSDAIGGVINVITKRGGQPGLALSGFVEGGSYATFRAGATAAGTTQRLRYRLSANGIRSDGISKADASDGNSERDGYRDIAVSANLDAEIVDGVEVGGFARYNDGHNQFDSFGFVTGVTDGDELTQSREATLEGHVVARLLDDRFHNRLSVGFTEIDRDNFSAGAPAFAAVGKRRSFDYQGNAKLAPGVDLIFGAEHEENEISTATEHDSINIDSLFGLINLVAFERLSLSAGLRHDDHETFGGVTTTRFTAAYDLAATGTILRGSWGEGFKAPSPFQLSFFCCGAQGPAVDLAPERSQGWDIGVEQKLADDRVKLKTSYFHQVTRDLIDFIFTPDFSLGQYQNIAEARSRGVEVEASAEPVDWLNLVASYSHIGAIDRETGLRRNRQPRDSATLNATLNPMAALKLGLGVKYSARNPDAFGTAPGWTRVDLKASYRLTDRLELYGRVENLLDKQYQQVFGFGAPGLSGYVGMRGRL